MSKDSSDKNQPRVKADRMAVGTTATLGATIVSRVAGIVNSIIIVRALGVYDVGVLAIIGLIVAVASVTASMGIPPAMVKFLSGPTPGSLREPGRLIGAGLVIVGISTAATVVIIVLLASTVFVSVYNDSRIPMLILVSLVSVVTSVVASTPFSVFQGFERILEMSIREMVISAISIPATYFLVQGYGLFGAVLVAVASSGIAVSVKVPLLRRVWREHGVKVTFPREPPHYRALLNFAIPAFLSTLMVTPVLWFSSTLLATSASFVALGQYSVANGLAGYLLLVSASIGIPLVPIVARLNRDDPGQVSPFLIKTLRITTFLSLPPAVVLVSLPSPFLSLLYGSQYMTAAPLVAILGPAMFLASLSSIVGYSIAGIGRMWDGFYLNLIWAVGLVVLSITLVPAYGAVGLALAVLGAYVGHFVGVLFYLRAALSVPLKALGPPVGTAGIALIGSAFAYALERPWNLVALSVGLGMLLIVEYFALSPRELAVLVGPARRVFNWIGRSP